MVTSRDRSVDLDGILLLSLAQDADHDAGEVGVGGQEVEAADRASSHFNAPSWRQVTRSSWHRDVSREWRRHRWRDGATATRRGLTFAHRRQPVFGRRSLLAREFSCGQSPTSPHIGRRNGSRSAGGISSQRGWSIQIAAHATPRHAAVGVTGRGGWHAKNSNATPRLAAVSVTEVGGTLRRIRASAQCKPSQSARELAE